MKIKESQLRNIIRECVMKHLKESEFDEYEYNIPHTVPDDELYGDEDYNDYMEDENGEMAYNDMDPIMEKLVNESVKKVWDKIKKKATDFVNDDSDDISKCTGGKCENFGDLHPNMKKIFGK